MSNNIDNSLGEKKKKSYVAQPLDLTTWAYWILVFSFGLYFTIGAISNQETALPFLLMFPALIGIVILLFVFPVRFFTFFITELVLRVYLFHVPKNMPVETVVITGKRPYFKPSFWTAPNFDTDLILIVNYLRMIGKPFSIYYDTTIEMFDKIMENKEIRIVYVVGHGRRHSFAIDSTTSLDYCKYNDPKFRKDFVYQIHCNGGKGKSLVEYVVPQENQAKCWPEHGLMTNLTIYQLFIDKIIKLKNYKGIHAFLINAWYSFLTALIPLSVFMLWGFIFLKMVTIQ